MKSSTLPVGTIPKCPFHATRHPDSGRATVANPRHARSTPPTMTSKPQQPPLSTNLSPFNLFNPSPFDVLTSISIIIDDAIPWPQHRFHVHEKQGPPPLYRNCFACSPAPGSVGRRHRQ